MAAPMNYSKDVIVWREKQVFYKIQSHLYVINYTLTTHYILLILNIKDETDSDINALHFIRLDLDLDLGLQNFRSFSTTKADISSPSVRSENRDLDLYIGKGRKRKYNKGY